MLKNQLLTFVLGHVKVQCMGETTLKHSHCTTT